MTAISAVGFVMSECVKWGNFEHGSSIFSEVQEWWGLVNIDREERSAFKAYKKTDLPQAAQKITS